MKKLLSAFLAIVMLVTAVPLTALADSPTPAAQSSMTSNSNQDEGIVLNKIATPRLGPDGKPDGTIDITIEAYTTGVVTSSTKVVPANIILVLDTSGSMENGGSTETVYTYSPVLGKHFQERHWEGGIFNGQWVYTDAYGFESSNTTYYIQVDGNYVSVRSAGTDENGFQYYSYRSGNRTTYVYPMLESDPAGVRRENNYSVVQFYSRRAEQVVTSKNRMELLIDGVNGFIDETYKANEGIANDADKHAIAIIKFADDSYYNGRSSTQDVNAAVEGNNKNSSGYNYSQVVAPLTTVNQAGVANLESHVSELSPGGATSVDYGLALATKMISDANNSREFSNRKNVVVVFTDGEPNHQSGYDQSVAATCISQAKALKDIGVTIFTICVDDDADSSAAIGSSNTDINKFMHYLSSNFPDATVGNNNVLDDGVATSEVEAAMSRGFYQTPNQDMSLASIFEVIAQSIEKPTIEVGESATLVDTVSPYFTIPEGTTGIDVLTSEKTATGWATPVDAGSSVTINIQNGRTVSVKGFDFDENYISETARDGFYGKKLILTFNIVPDYNAIDNSADAVDADGKIKTNQGNATLNDSSMKAVAEVASPALPINKVTYVVDGVTYKTVYRFAGADVTLIPEPADTAVLDYGTWTSDDVTIANGGFEMPGEDVIVYLTSTTKSYKVTYRYSGTVPAGTPAAPAEAIYKVGETVKVASPVTVEGYNFIGWNTVSATVSGGEFAMPAHDVEFIGYFSAGTVIYTVEHYLQNADGTWPTDPTTTHTHDGTTGTKVTAHTDIKYPNFTLDLTHEGTIAEGTVAADGSLVLKLYYKRAQNIVKYEYTGTVPAGAPALPASATYYYGADVVLAGVPSVAGYTFIGWATDGADVIIVDLANGKGFTMPARDVTIKGTFVPNEGTSYKVEHYLETANGTYELKETTSHTGTTGATATAVPGNYPSYSHYPAHPNAKESGVIAGDGSLVLKVYYNRDPYKVKYTITGAYLPEGVTVPATAEYEWGTIVNVADVLAADGYVFYGWVSDDVTVENGKFTMPAHDVEFTGYFIKETATYTIEHYLMSPEGVYPSQPTESYKQTGNVGDSVTAAYITTFVNVTPDTDHEGTKQSGVIVSNKNGDELVLKLYYERKTALVIYEYIGTLPDVIPSLPATKMYRAGETVTVEDVPTLEGYIFNGWLSSDVSIQTGEFTMPNTDVTIVGYFEADTGTKYTVKHWVETNNGYELRLEAVHTGTTDTTATATPESFRGYTFVENHPQNRVSGNIEGDGSLVLELYYDRDSFKVTYNIVGDIIPEGVTAPAEKEYEWGTTVRVEDVFDIKGYIFIGWDTSSATVANGQFTMPASDVSFTGRFVYNMGVYTAEHYLQNADGTWPTTPTTSHTHEGVVGTIAEAHTHIVYPNFTLNTNIEGTILRGEIKEDGSLVLKLYYERAKFNVEYEYIGDVPAGAPELPDDATHYYNSNVALAPVPTLAGYTFIGWATDGADVIIIDSTTGKYFTMPGRNVVIKGTFLANSDTVYTVEHYLESDNGYVLADRVQRTGTTGATANALPGNYTGYTHNPDHRDAKESGVIAGDGSLVLKVFYDKTPYKVHYSITGDVPAGAVVPATETHDFSNTVSVASYVELAGYKFIGWTTTDVTVNADGEFTMPARDVYFSGYYVKTIAGYTVEHYLMDTNGQWPATPAESYSIIGNIGATVSADYLTFAGFTPARDHEDTLLSGEVKGDGTLVLKLYYARNKYKVTYSYTSAPDRAPALPAAAEYYYGESVLKAGVPSVSGYTFYGWTTDDVEVFGDEFTMPMNDVEFTGYFIAGPSKYTVEHYKQNIDGTYNRTPDDTDVFTEGVKVDDFVVAQFKTYEGFTPVTTGVYSGVVTPEPDTLVIKLYYTRNTYNVSYVYFGVQPEGAPDVSVNNLTGVKYGERVTIAQVPTLADHAFDGWHSLSANLQGEYFTMPAHDVTLYGNFIKVIAAYRVEHYLQNTDGTWSDTPYKTYSYSGNVGQTITAEYFTFKGFTPAWKHEDTVLSGEITADDTLVLKLYYARNKYKVTYVYENAPENAPALPAEAEYYYGVEVNVADVPSLYGYTFNGWTTDDVTVSDGKFTMPDSDVTLTGNFVRVKAECVVEHYLQNADGTWSDIPTEAFSVFGNIGETVKAEYLEFEDYTPARDHEDTILSGVVDEERTLVLKLYYARNKYKVTYVYENAPENAPALPAEKEYFFGEKVTIADIPTLEDYVFEGWTSTTADFEGEYFTMPKNDVVIYGSFVMVKSTYRVEHYLQNTDGTWPETTSHFDVIKGSIGETVTAEYKTFEGFTRDTDNANTVISGVVNEDGTLVLKLYYARNKYKVTYSYTSAPENAPALPAEAEYYYGAEVNVAELPVLNGYTFYGWTTDDVTVSDGKFTMPDADVEFTGYFAANGSKYTVEHYLENLDGTYNETPDDTDVFTEGVKVGDFVEAQFKTYEGFTAETTSVNTGVVTPEPDTLVIKLYYTRNSYDVSYIYIGTQPDGAPDVSVNNLTGVKYGEKVTIAQVPTLEDYVFDGWHSTTADLEGEYFTMPAHDVVLQGSFVLVKSTYRVEHYLQNTDGTWPETTSHFDIIKGSIGETVTAEYKTFEGFTRDTDNANTVISGVVDEDGTLVLKLYYARNKYKVTYVYENAPENAPALPAEKEYYYGETVTVAEAPAVEHFTFGGWTTADATISAGKFTMPTHDVVITGKFTQDDFIYKVNYFVDGKLYASFEVYSNDVHTIIDKPEYPAPITFKGWSEPINAVTGQVVPTFNGMFVMPEADVNIYGERKVDLPSNGGIIIEKELDAPAGFTRRYFNFTIYREYGTRLELVKTIVVKAGEKVSISLAPGIYYVREENAEVDGYTLITTTDVENRIVVKAGRVNRIKFTNSYSEPILERDDHFGYIIGYPDGLVRPEANITRAEVATIFFRMLTDEARAKYWSQTNNFSDVTSSDWYNNAISTLAKAGVLNGYADGTFRPNAYITRAELVKIAVSFFNTSAGQSTHFSDASNHWATDFIAAAESFGFINGYEDGTFRPDKFVTRAEAMKVINRTLGRNPHKEQLLPGMITWADNTADKWYYADVQEATNSHIYLWDDFGYEIWDALLPVRDWAALEKEWSTANAD